MNIRTEVAQVIAALDVIATSANPVRNFGDGYKQIGINFSIKACEIAAEITGYDPTFCKMLNNKFRSDAAKWAMEVAA